MQRQPALGTQLSESRTPLCGADLLCSNAGVEVVWAAHKQPVVAGKAGGQVHNCVAQLRWQVHGRGMGRDVAQAAVGEHHGALTHLCTHCGVLY
eukprot:scaffold79416_cov21-Tisochrysis_lutea.AAC.1